MAAFDDFNRANETPLGAPYTVIEESGYNLLSNQASADTSVEGQGVSHNQIQPAVQEFAIVVGVGNNSGFWLVMNLQEIDRWRADHIEIDFEKQAGTDTVSVWLRESEVWTNPMLSIALPTDFNPGDILKARHETGRVKAWLNAVEVVDFVISAVEVSGYVGVVGANNLGSGGLSTFDDLNIGVGNPAGKVAGELLPIQLPAQVQFDDPISVQNLAPGMTAFQLFEDPVVRVDVSVGL